MPEENIPKYYTYKRFAIDFASAKRSELSISILICNKCGAIVGDTELHNTFHNRTIIKITNS